MEPRVPLQRWEMTKPYIDLHCLLGEGPFYEAETNSLRFVDIRKKHVHSFSLDQGPDSLKTVQLDVPVTVTADVEGYDPKEKILVGLKYGLALLDRAAGTYEYFAELADGERNPRIRTNDGAVDPHGRFWLGTMTDFGQGELKPEGYLARFDGSKAKETVLQGLTIPNAIGWSPDLRTMYFTHTTTNTVTAWDYSPADGALSNQRIFYQHDGAGGLDGFRLDVEGNMWHAVYGAAKVLKISPEGKLVGEIALPTRNVTCPEFAGTELFITTAADEEGLGGPESKAYGGGLYRVDVGVRGVPPFAFKLSK